MSGNNPGDEIKQTLQRWEGVPLSHADIRSFVSVGKNAIARALGHDDEVVTEDRTYPDRPKKRTRCWSYVGAPGDVGIIPSPDVEFSDWFKWGERGSKKGEYEKYGGVYLFGHSRGGPPPRVALWDQLPESIVYVGETKDLAQRPLTTHNRTKRFKKVMRDSNLKKLYVCVCPLYPTKGYAKQLLRAYAVYLEAQIDWEYTRRYRKRPALHFKEKKEEAS